MALTAGQVSLPARGTQRPPVSCFRHCKRAPRLTTVNASQQSNANFSPIAKDAKNIFIFGLGYTSIALANWLAADGWRVSGTCRTRSRIDGLRAKGWAVDLYDPARGVGLTSQLSSQLEGSPYVLSSVPPLGLALYDPALAAQKALLRPLAASGRLAWFGYLSSTGVYGDWQGEWVDESSPCRQTSAKAIVRQEAEAAWLQMYEQYGLPVHIFRLGGIYGPGRSVLDTLLSQPADLSSSQRRRGRQRYTARCHVYDICVVLTASMARPRPGGVYNVADDDPAPRTDVMTYARSLLAGAAAAAGDAADDGGSVESVPTGDEAAGMAATASQQQQAAQQQQQQLAGATTAASVAAPAATPSAEANDGANGAGASGAVGAASVAESASGAVGAAAAARGREVLEEKRVRNIRIREELGVRLHYPTYREGVAAIHSGECWPLSAGDLQLLI